MRRSVAALLLLVPAASPDAAAVPLRALDAAEIAAVLAEERIVRLAVQARSEFHVVSMFYTWHEGALCGIAAPGRFTQMAARSPRAGFLVESQGTNWPWAWSSVSGDGEVEFATDLATYWPWVEKLRASLAAMPEWAAHETEERYSRLGMVPWRLRPSVLSGRAQEQPPAANPFA